MRINTNIAALNAEANNAQTNQNLTNSLEKLSSGLKINKAADDASGMAIADKLRMQANTIGQGIANANSGSALIQIADKAMSEQSSILDTVKTKLLQAATTTTSDEGREAIRKDIQKLLNQIDNISLQTTYNGVNLLNEKGAEFNFQVGEKSTDVIGMSTAYAVNTGGLGSAGNDSTTLSTVKLTAAGVAIEGEVNDVTLDVKSTLGSVILQGNTVATPADSADASFEVSANTVTGFSIVSSISSGVMLSTTDSDLKARLSEEAGKSSSDALTKLSDGVFMFNSTAGGASTFSFSNGVAVDISNLTISGLSSGTAAGRADAFSLSTTETVHIHKTSGTQDVNTGAAAIGTMAPAGGDTTYTLYGDTADGIDFGTAAPMVTDGTIAVQSDLPSSTTSSYIAINDAAGTKQEELSFTVAADDVKSIVISMSAGTSSVTLSTTDANTASALESLGEVTKNLDGTYTVAAASANDQVTLDFGDSGINIASLSFSNVLKTTTGGSSNERIFIETSKTVTIANDNTSTESNTGDFSVQTGFVSSGGVSVSTDLSAGSIDSGLAFKNLSGLLALGEGGLTADMALNFMSVVDDAMTQLNTVRSDFGSTQNQLAAATRNMTVTKVNVQAAESVIRDVDYAEESANFNKQNIIAQAGTYALSQANQVQQNVLRLLQ